METCRAFLLFIGAVLSSRRPIVLHPDVSSLCLGPACVVSQSPDPITDLEKARWYATVYRNGYR
jgi:hypothetical protein